MHGHAIDENEAVRLATAAYENMQTYIVSNHGLKSVKSITNAPRRFETHQWFGAFLKCTGSVPPTLPEMSRAGSTWASGSMSRTAGDYKSSPGFLRSPVFIGGMFWLH